MADSRSGAGNVQDEPGAYCPTREQEKYQRILGSWLKDSEANLKGRAVRSEVVEGEEEKTRSSQG